MPSPLAVLVSPDLMLSSQIELACRRSGVTLQTATPQNWQQVAAAAQWVFWDLSRELPQAADVESFQASRAEAAEPACQLIAFGPHVDETRLQQARDAGCQQVLPRGQFLRSVAAILNSPLAGDTP